MPPRFFCSRLPAASLSEPAPEERVCTLGAEEAKHARKVLRLSAGAAIEVFDGGGRVAEAEIIEFVRGGRAEGGGEGAVCRVGEVREVAATRPRLTVASAVPKGPRAEAMVNQLGQLGADVFVPVRSERSVVEPGGGKVERYAKASLAATKQSGRAWTMAVEPTVSFEEILSRPAGLRLILDPGGVALPNLGQRLNEAEDVVLLVGPEGGWTEEELAKAEAAGFTRWRMAEHVLRIETAATAAVSILRYAATAKH